MIYAIIVAAVMCLVQFIRTGADYIYCGRSESNAHYASMYALLLVVLTYIIVSEPI